MPEEIIRRKRRLSSFQIITLGFAGVILLGALLLMLPISTTGENVTPFNETLFTATSSVCVTGLVVQDTGCYWSTFGQAVILPSPANTDDWRHRRSEGCSNRAFLPALRAVSPCGRRTSDSI